MAIAIGMWESGQWDGTKWKHGTSTVANVTVARQDLAYCGTILAHSRDLAREASPGQQKTNLIGNDVGMRRQIQKWTRCFCRLPVGG